MSTKYKLNSCKGMSLNSNKRDLTDETKKTRTDRCIEYLIVYFHIIAFKKFILESTRKAIKPVRSDD